MNQEEIKFLKLQNEINLKFEKLMVAQEAHWNSLNLEVLGISSKAIAKRLTQIFVVEKYKVFNQKIFENMSYEADLDFSKTKVFEYLKNYLRFVGYLLKFYCLGTISFFSARVPFGNSAIIVDIHGFDSLFKEELAKQKNFFNEGPVEFFKNSSHILITSLKPFYSSKYSFIKNPWLELLKSDQIKLHQWFSFSYTFIKVFLIFSYAVVKNPIMTKLFRDFGFLPLVEFINARKIVKDYTFTNTLGDEQNLSISSLANRTFITHFTSYSANSRQMKYFCHGDDEFAEYPYFRNIIVDQAWLWNQDQANWLNAFNSSIKVFVVGPILFYLPDLQAQKVTQKKSAVLFDVTPYPEERIKDRMGWHGYNYYQAENALKIVNDIIEVLDGYQILIKPKRPYSAEHDQQYIQLVNQFAQKNKLELLDCNVNTYQVINDSDLVITTPYSSPALIAPYLGKKAIYYDPTGLVLCNYLLPSGVYFCSGKDQLKSLVESLFNSR